MSTVLVAKRFRCDLCGAEAVVNDPDVGRVPDGWGVIDLELYAHGLRIRDFCGACLMRPFGEALAEIMRRVVKTSDDDDA